MKTILIFSAFIIYWVHSVGAGNQCQTPDQKDGKCISLLECNLLSNILTSPKLSVANRNFLSRSQCGTGRYPLVCCPDGLNSFGNRKGTQSSNSSYKDSRDDSENSSNKNGRPSSRPTSNQNSRPGRPTSQLIYRPITLNAHEISHSNGNNQGLGSQRPANDDFHFNIPLINDHHNGSDNITDTPTENGRGIKELPNSFWHRPKSRRPNAESNTSKTVGLYESDLPSPPVCGTVFSDRIVGGNETSIGEFPWLALIIYNIRSLQCAGSLINQNYVITAAHCVKSEDLTRNKAKPVLIRLGEHNLIRERDCEECDLVKNFPIQSIIAHENYEAKKNDIALIRLAQSAEITHFIQPICLPFAQRNRIFDNVPLIAAGFGKTEIPSKRGTKQKVQVNGVNFDDCKQKWTDIDSTQLCAGGEEGKDSCHGDSGGPLMGFSGTRKTNYMFLAGIISHGLKECGQRGVPGVYTRVDQYLEWILRHMEP